MLCVYVVDDRRRCFLALKYLFSHCVFLLMLSLTTQAGPPNSCEAFDCSIYDQTGLEEYFQGVRLSSNNINQDDIQAVILQHLTFQKLNLLNRRVFHAIDKQLEDLKTLQEKYGKSVAQKVLAAMSKGGTLVGGALLVGSVAGPVGEAAAVAIEGPQIAGLVIGGVGAAAGGIQDFLDPEGNIDIERLRAQCEREKKNAILRMNDEPLIADLEIQYILLKPLLKNEALKQTIEEKLISMRRNKMLPMEYAREFLANCLKIPFEKKVIVPANLHTLLRNEPDAGIELTAEQRAALTRLKHYAGDVQEELERIVLGTQLISGVSSSTRVPFCLHRRFFYFYGEPGTGKSTAAKDLARFLGVPFYETNIRTGEDVSQNALEGTDWMMPNTTLGHFGKAFTSGFVRGRRPKSISCRLQALAEYGASPHFRIEVPDDVLPHTFQNPILIINDFDRLLTDPQTATQTLAFFLDYLDPDKHSFFNNYFNLRLPMQDIMVVITGNNPDFLQEGAFAALRDRLTPIAFPYLEEDVRRGVLSRYSLALEEKFHVNVAAHHRQQTLEAAVNEPSVRSGKKVLETRMLDLIRQGEVQAQPAAEEDDQPEIEGAFHQLPDYELDGIFIPATALQAIFADQHQRKKVGSLRNIWITTQKMESSRATEQANALHDLLGWQRSWWKNAWGQVQCFWETRRGRTYTEEAGGIGALANRLHRLEAPKDRHELVEAHIQILNKTMRMLLEIKKPGEDRKDGAFLYRLIERDAVKKRNLCALRDHLKCFETRTRLEEKFTALRGGDNAEERSEDAYLKLEDGTKILLRGFAKFIRDENYLTQFEERFEDMIDTATPSHTVNVQRRDGNDEDDPLLD